MTRARRSDGNERRTGGTADDLARLLGALADPARLDLVRALLRRERSAGELAAATRASPSATSNRLRRLAEEGLVEARREGRRRLYRLAQPEARRLLPRLEALAAAAAAARTAPRRRRRRTLPP